MKKNKILKNIAVISLLVAVISLSLYFVKATFLQDSTSKTNGYFVNDIYDSPSKVLGNGKAITEKFSTAEDIYGVRIRFHNGGTPQQGTVLIEVIDDISGELVAYKECNAETILNDAYTGISFDEPYKNNENKDFTLKITMKFKDANGYLRIWQDSGKGIIAFGLITYIVSDFIYSWFNIFSFLIILSAIVIYLVTFVFTLKKETVFVIVLCLVSIMFNFVLPPYSSPDEKAHINSAQKMSNRLFDGYSELDTAYETIYKRAGDYNPILEDHITTVFSYEEIYNGFFKFSTENEIVPKSDNWVVRDFPLVYLMGAIGIKIGTLLNLGIVPLLYLGRLFNLLFFAFCGFMAIKITPIGKEIFMVLSFLPITLHIANSFSRDTFVIAISFIFIAYLLHLLYEKDSISIKDLLALATLCIVLAPSKMIYFGICMLVLLLYKKKLSIAFKVNTKIVIGAVAVLIIAVFLATNYWVQLQLTNIANTGISFEEMLINNPESTFNLSVILANPMVVIKLVFTTIFANLSYYIKSIAGGILGYNNVIISDLFVFIFLLLIFISTFKAKDERYDIKTSHKISFISVFLLLLALIVYVALTWTFISHTTIYGIQGKYLIPAIPLLLLASKNKIFTLTQDIFKPLCFIAGITNIYVALNVFVIIVQR